MANRLRVRIIRASIGYGLAILRLLYTTHASMGSVKPVIR